MLVYCSATDIARVRMGVDVCAYACLRLCNRQCVGVYAYVYSGQVFWRDG